ELILWFEHDLFDQLALIRLLARLARRGLPAQLTLVSIDRHPEVPNFLGLGQLKPEQLAELWPRRTPLSRDAIDEAITAWIAVTPPDPPRAPSRPPPGGPGPCRSPPAPSSASSRSPPIPPAACRAPSARSWPPSRAARPPPARWSTPSTRSIRATRSPIWSCSGPST